MGLVWELVLSCLVCPRGKKPRGAWWKRRLCNGRGPSVKLLLRLFCGCFAELGIRQLDEKGNPKRPKWSQRGIPAYRHTSIPAYRHTGILAYRHTTKYQSIRNNRPNLEKRPNDRFIRPEIMIIDQNSLKSTGNK